MSELSLNSIERTIIDMQAEIATLRQQIEIERNASRITDANLTGELERLDEENRSLRQQLAASQAGQWVPVEDGEWSHGIIMRNNEFGFSKLAIEGGQIITIADSNVGVAVHCLNDDLRLCRRVEPEWLDQPDSEGWWAFSGKVVQSDPIRSEVFELREIDGELIAFGCAVVWSASMMVGKWQRLHIAWPEGA